MSPTPDTTTTTTTQQQPLDITAFRRLQGTTIPSPTTSFEGIASIDFGGQGVPPDTVGDVGPNHYVQMVNYAFAVFDKAGNVLIPATTLGQLWNGFAVMDCSENSGDPIVLYDQFVDRWLLTQFTRGCTESDSQCFNCLAISSSPDPTGTYYRYAVPAQKDPSDGEVLTFFPDYPKYGVWSDSYILTTRDFGVASSGVSVYAIEKQALINNLDATYVQHFLDENIVDFAFTGDGLLPPDIDGSLLPPAGQAAPIVGTMDDQFAGNADALNIFELSVDWTLQTSTLVQNDALETESYDSFFDACGQNCVSDPFDQNKCNFRDCLPQPGAAGDQFLDILSYRQRPLHRLAYRNFGDYESLVTCQTVEARANQAGKRWYEIRRSSSAFSIHQQGIYAPDDGLNRWMGSIAQDQMGNMAIGYSVVSDTVFPGIRYTGRLAGDALNEMTLGEESLIEGGGIQETVASRWGDYSSMNIDPVDDCTFWYTNQYYARSSLGSWQTRIGSFTMPNCRSGSSTPAPNASPPSRTRAPTLPGGGTSGKGKGKGMKKKRKGSRSKGMGMGMSKGKGMSKGMGMSKEKKTSKGKGMGMGMPSSKGKGMDMDTWRSKGKGKGVGMDTGMSRSKGKGKDMGMDTGKSRSKGKGKGMMGMSVSRSKGKGKGMGMSKDTDPSSLTKRIGVPTMRTGIFVETKGMSAKGKGMITTSKAKGTPAKGKGVGMGMASNKGGVIVVQMSTKRVGWKNAQPTVRNAKGKAIVVVVPKKETKGRSSKGVKMKKKKRSRF